MTDTDCLRVAAGICRRVAQGQSTSAEELVRGLSEADLRALVAVGRAHRCLPLLAPVLVPAAAPELAREVEQLSGAAWASYELTVATLGPVFERAHARGVRVIVHKGAAHAARSYGEPWRRQMQDVDLLLEPDGVRALQELLAAAGYQDLTTPGRARSTELSHERTMIAGTQGVRMVDLHTHPAPPLRHPFEWASLFSRARSLPVFGSPAFVLRPEDELIVTAVNQAYDHFRGTLLRAVDGALMLAGESVDWSDLVEAAERAQARVATWMTLRWMRELAAAAVPDDVLARLHPGPRRAAWLGALFGPVERPSPRMKLPRRLEQVLLTPPLMDRTSTFLRYTARHTGRRLIDAWRSWREGWGR